MRRDGHLDPSAVRSFEELLGEYHSTAVPELGGRYLRPELFYSETTPPSFQQDEVHMRDVFEVIAEAEQALVAKKEKLL